MSTLTVETPVNAVRIDTTVPAGADRISIYREGPSGTPAGVRAWVDAMVTPGPLIVRDFEPPLGVPLTYTITTWAAATPDVVTTETLTITVPVTGSCDTWLTDLVRS